MATFVPAKVSTQFIFYASLVSQANTKINQVNPTIASGDFKVSIDGGALANLGTLPTVTPAGGSMVKFTLSISEMAGANATVVCIDAAGSEWCDATFNIQTAARQVDDLAYPATSGRSMVVDAAGLVDANVVKVGPTGSGTAQTARDIGASVLVGDKTGFSLSAAGVQAIWDALTSALTTVGSVGKRVADFLTGDAYARLGAPAGASVSADVASVKTDTGTTIPGKLPTSLAADGSIKASLQSILGSAFTEGAGGRIAAAFKQFFNIASPAATMDHGILVDTATAVGTLTTYTGNTPQTGDAYARIGANGVSLSAIPDEAGVTTLLSRLSATRAGYLDNLSAGAVATASALASLVTTVGAAGAGLTAVALTSAYNFAKGTVAMTESYAALHAAPTPVEALFGQLQYLMERAVSGTTETTKKVDGSTTAYTRTLNDGTNPTSGTRAT